MIQAFVDYFKCPVQFGKFELAQDVGQEKGFFRFGDSILYGRTRVPVCADAADGLQDASSYAAIGDAVISLPFDPTEVAQDLRFERYIHEKRRLHKDVVRHAYYRLRPLLPVSIRKHLQRLSLRNRLKLPFPQWPIDNTLDNLFRNLMARTVEAHGCEIPFVWFWPNAYQSCYIMTHDVEHEPGRAFCLDLMRLDQEYGTVASFQLVPEERYVVKPQFRRTIENAGFEVNVHDLNHDGRLFGKRERFLRRAAKINSYGKAWGAKGFRAGAMYRNADWLNELTFAYDMSVPNAAHMEPQFGGCCTLMPFQMGGMVELPLTATQDYTLFHMLDNYSVDLWMQEVEFLERAHGLISLIVHPDYVVKRRARQIYVQLLAHLAELRQKRRIWHALPCEVAKWWKQRSALELKYEEGRWKICGPGAESACLAFATFVDGELQYRMVSTVNTLAQHDLH
jgi:hypothetical protein